MSAALLDVNVLIALFDPGHPNHNEAHHWFGTHRRRGWATCPHTVNGCVRVLSNPAYPSITATIAEVIARLHSLCSASDHAWWADEISLLDGDLFRPGVIAGHQKITDVYLLGLAVRKNGTLVTFDRSIPHKAVIGADRCHLKILGGVAEPADG